MVSETHKCPQCDTSEPVIRFGFNRCGTQRLRCKACGKTWTPKGRSRQLSPEKEGLIAAALSERLSQRAIARTFKVARSTVQEVLKKVSAVPAELSRHVVASDCGGCFGDG